MILKSKLWTNNKKILTFYNIEDGFDTTRMDSCQKAIYSITQDEKHVKCDNSFE